MLEIVSGKPRRGKTSYVVAKTIVNDLKFFNDRYKSSCEYIRYLSEVHEVELSLPPERHVVSSNIDICKNFPTMRSYRMSGWDFGLPNPYHNTKRLIPYGLYIFDEAHKYFDSKGGQALPPWVTQAFELRGHIFLDIVLISQRHIRIHPDIRATADIFTWIDESIHYFKIGKKTIKSNKFLNIGKLVKTVWKGRQFEDEYTLDMYIKGEKTLGAKFTYIFEGDIRKHYDPYSFADIVEDHSGDFSYYDFTNTFSQRPNTWDNYKKTPKAEKEHEEK